MSLQSNFPKTRKYYFWAIFLCHLTATDSKSTEAEKKLFGTLAYRMASKAAESAPSDPVCSRAASRYNMIITTATERIAQPTESHPDHRRATAAGQDPRNARPSLRNRETS